MLWPYAASGRGSIRNSTKSLGEFPLQKDDLLALNVNTQQRALQLDELCVGIKENLSSTVCFYVLKEHVSNNFFNEKVFFLLIFVWGGTT